MAFRKIYIFPILLGLWLPITVLITYSVSVVTEHVTPILPYISDTGTWAPESCIFGIMVTIGAFLLLIVTYVRFMHLAEIHQKHNISRILITLNKYSFYVATLSVLGCLIVANFQVSQTLIIHLMGAGLCFGFGVIYQISQVILSFKTFPMIGHKAVNIFRCFLTVTAIVTFMSTCICGYISIIQFKGKDMTKWKEEDGGYIYHVNSAISEYILVAVTVLHLVTFVQEFRDVEIHQPVITSRTYAESKDMTKWKEEDGGYIYHVNSAISEYILVAVTVLHLVTFVQEFRDVEIHQPVITSRTYAESD